MGRIFVNKWFILASLLTISLSAFSFMAYQHMETACTISRDCGKKPTKGSEKSDLPWDIFARQLPTVSFQ